MANRKNNRLRTVVVTVGVLLLLGFLGAFRPVVQPLSRAVAWLASPLYAAGAAVSRASDRLFAPEGTPSPEIQTVIDGLRAENAKLREFAVENVALKTALGYREKSGLAPLLARVVSETDEDVFHGLVIDRGSEDGVREGQAVIAGEGVIIGKILSVKRTTASVLLLSDTRSRLAVTVQRADGTAGVLEGDRGLSTVIDLIPQTVSIAPGDTVVTSGIEAGIPRGLIVGVIDKVTQHSQDPFQSATVVPFEGAARPPIVQVLTTDEAGGATVESMDINE